MKLTDLKKQFDVPVLFLVYNRIDTATKVFAEIQKAQPLKLYVAADGPRANEAQKCLEVRELIEKGMNWNCDIYTLYRDRNLGCKTAVSNAIDWFFAHEEEGIILEDDCLPNQSFFWFCKHLLEKFRNDTRIMHISGNNFQKGIIRSDGSYYFSLFTHIWGWATWKRAWRYYDVDIKSFPEFKKQKQISNIFLNSNIQKFWVQTLQKIYEKKIDTWDFQWNYACLVNNGLSILPNVNLVSNIGFGDKAIHTGKDYHKLANLSTSEMKFPLKHPTFVLPNNQSDYFTFKNYFTNKLIIIFKIVLDSILNKKKNEM